MARKQLWSVSKLAKQSGIASIIIVFIITVLISILSLGFARLMDRALRNESNSQLSSDADYAAQSGINDTISYVKKKPATNVNKCSGLTNPDDSSDSFVNYYQVGQTGDKTKLNSDGTTKYTCVLIDPVPGDLQYLNIPAYNSQVVRLEPAGGAITETTIAWEANNPLFRNSSSNFPNFPNEQTWDSGKYRPVLRVTLYPVAGSNVPSAAAAKTFYLYPAGSGGTLSFSSASGTIRQGNCSASANSCKVTINGLTAALYYARLTPLYTSANVTITGKNNTNPVSFEHAQSSIDVTGRSQTAVRRIQARVATGDNNGIVPGDGQVPEDAIRSAGTICKRIVVPDGSGPFGSHVYNDLGSNHPECKFFENTIPAPTVDLKPDSGTITDGDSVVFTWTSTNSLYCTADWTTSTDTNNTTGVIIKPSSTRDYKITCNGPNGQASDSSTITVNAKPPGTPPTPPPPVGGSGCPYGSSGGNGTSSPPNPCIYGVIATYYSGSLTLSIQVSATHCYGGLSGSWPGGSGGLNWGGSEGYSTTTVTGNGSGSSITATCSGNGVASHTITIPNSTYTPPSNGCSNGATNPPACNNNGGGCTPIPGCPPSCGGADTCSPNPVCTECPLGWVGTCLETTGCNPPPQCGLNNQLRIWPYFGFISMPRLFFGIIC